MSQKKVTRPCESKHARLSCSLLLYVEWLIREVTQYKCQQSWTRGSHGHIHLRMHSNKPSLERHSTPLRGQAHDRFWNARTFPMLFRSRDPIAGTFIRHLHNTRIRHENRTMTNQKNWLRIQHQFQLNKITDFAFSMTKTGLRIGTCFSGGCFFFVSTSCRFSIKDEELVLDCKHNFGTRDVLPGRKFRQNTRINRSCKEPVDGYLETAANARRKASRRPPSSPRSCDTTLLLMASNIQHNRHLITNRRQWLVHLVHLVSHDFFQRTNKQDWATTRSTTNSRTQNHEFFVEIMNLGENCSWTFLGFWPTCLINRLINILTFWKVHGLKTERFWLIGDVWFWQVICQFIYIDKERD